MLRLIFLIMCVYVCSENASAEEIPRNWQLGLGAPPTIETPVWNYTVSRGVSRTEGVAPLSVFFSGGLEESTQDKRSYHHYEYIWDFGDQIQGRDEYEVTWGTSKRSKNKDKGPVASHVYEIPGTYDAVLTIRDASGVVEEKVFTIVVSDPSVVFTGTKTTCISNSDNFLGCPSGANQVQVAASDIEKIANYTEAGERVLLHRGSEWNADDALSFPSNYGPVSIGAFGECESRDEQGICRNAPKVNYSGENSFVGLNGKHDWRIADISFVAPKGAASVVSGTTDIEDILMLRIKSEGFQVGVGLAHWYNNDDDYIDKVFLVSSRIQNFTGNGVYIGGERLVLMGNILANSDTTHVCRIWQAYQSVISHNYISGSSLTNSAGRHALKLHGSTPFGKPNGETFVGTFAQTGKAGLRNHSKFIVISNNVFGSSGPWPVSIGPQNGALDERVSDVIFEKNKVFSAFGEQSPTQVQVSVGFEGRYFTARNNIIDGTGAATDFRGISVWRRGVELPPLGAEIYYNTIYRSDAPNDINRGVYISSDSSYTIVKNNLVAFPFAVSQTMAVINEGDNNVIENNLLTDSPQFIAIDGTDLLLWDFTLQEGSAGIDAGVQVPVYDDINGSSRIGLTPDIGATER